MGYPMQSRVGVELPPRCRPRRPKRCPRGPQDVRKTPQDPLKRSQDAPKTCQDVAQDDPRDTPEASRGTQDAPRPCQDSLLAFSGGPPRPGRHFFGDRHLLRGRWHAQVATFLATCISWEGDGTSRSPLFWRPAFSWEGQRQRKINSKKHLKKQF